MRRFVSALVCMAILGLLAVTAQAANSTPAKIRVLLITGDDASAHHWREQSEATRDALVSAGRFNVKVCEDPLILESQTALGAYDVIVFMPFNATTPMLTETAKTNLLDFVQGGKGFFVQHLASASYGKWDEFGRLCGRHWVMGKSGHGPRGVFDAKVADQEHPITRGLDNFQADDELYSKLQGDTPIHVLVEAYSTWSKKTEPLVFWLDYGKGRVVHNCFGHDGRCWQIPACGKSSPGVWSGPPPAKWPIDNRPRGVRINSQRADEFDIASRRVYPGGAARWYAFRRKGNAVR